MLTTPYVFNARTRPRRWPRPAPTSSSRHLGLTTGGAIGAETALTLDDCPALIDAWAEAALAVKPDIIVLVHGGPIAKPEDADYVLANTDELPRLLRRLLDGAAADRDGADRADATVQD